MFNLNFFSHFTEKQKDKHGGIPLFLNFHISYFVSFSNKVSK